MELAQCELMALREFGCRSQESSSLFTELNSLWWSELLKNASHMKWSAALEGLSKRSSKPDGEPRKGGPLEPDAHWLSWADFANKVYHIWRLDGPQLRERPEDERRVRLPVEEVEETPAVGPEGM
eukprot:2094397-Amphidinium_carterae.1